MSSERARLRILYEDKLSDALHQLVLRAAHDHCEQLDFWTVLRKRIVALPLKGRDKVLAGVRDSQAHFNAGVCLLAWLDADRVREAFSSIPDASRWTRSEVISRIKAIAGHHEPARIEVFLLDKNLESLLRVLRRELVVASNEDIVSKAIEKKRPDQRDALLKHIALQSDLRTILRERHQGFDCVTRYIAAIATLEPWPFHGT